MTTPTYRVRPAGPEDLDDVIELRRYAEEWLATAGIDQWTSSTTGDRVIKEHFDDGRLFVVEDQAGYVVASLSLGPGDPDFWTPAELAEPATYLYKFITGPTARGTGLGDVLLDWASYQAEMYHSLYLRLDCHRTNTSLHRYYVERGFTHLDTRSAPGRMSGALFERFAEVRRACVAVQLVDGTDRDSLFNRPATRHGLMRGPTMNDTTNEPTDQANYDPTGEAAIWEAAAALVTAMKRGPVAGDELNNWDTALTQAARALETEGRKIKQRDGMYYRVLDGSDPNKH